MHDAMAVPHKLLPATKKSCMKLYRQDCKCIICYNTRLFPSISQGLSVGSSDGSSGSFTLWGIITWLFQLLMNFVTLVKSFFGIGGSSTNQGETTPTQRSVGTFLVLTWGCPLIISLISLSFRSYSANSKLKGKKVRQFHPGEYEDNSSDDDEERRNTYNGNSTEQQ